MVSVFFIKGVFFIRRTTFQDRRTQQAPINENIQAKEVRLIGADGAQIGVVTIDEALIKAQEAILDLVEINASSDPPVCKILDYGKYLYEIKKQKAAAKKKQLHIQIKEIKFRPGTESGDYDVKLRNLKRFLAEGNKTKVSLRFRGREMVHQSIGLELMKKIQEDLSGEGVVEHMPKMEGRQLIMVIAPRKKN